MIRLRGIILTIKKWLRKLRLNQTTKKEEEQMKKIIVKAPAKVNLTLDVVEKTRKYHAIKTLVASIDLCDEITIKDRKDRRINLTVKGIPMDCEVTENNAYKAAKAFMDKFSTMGADIKIVKNIPLSSGLGGSSADTAGVLKGMKELYNLDCDLTPLANTLGSDTAYMLDGGFAVLEGRGEKITKKQIDTVIYFVIIAIEQGVSAKESYLEFDKQKKTYKQATDTAIKSLELKEYEFFKSCISNHLYNASIKLAPEIVTSKSNLERAGATAVTMSGSGSSVIGVFFDKKERDNAYRKLAPLYGDKVIRAQTI